MKHTVVVLVAALAASSLANAAELIAGWDTWDTGGTPTATRLATDVSATAVTLFEEGELNRPWRVNDGRGASFDGDWGTVVTDPVASMDGGEGVLSECLELGNATSGGTITLSITNNGASDIVLGSFNFDVYAFRPKAARTYELSVADGGGISAGVVFTSEDGAIPHVGGAWNNEAHTDIDLDLTGLEDNTLAPGESADLRLTVSGGAGDGTGGHDLWIDNLGVFTATVEGPAITDIGITKDGADVTLTFVAVEDVAIFRSDDLEEWEELSDGTASPFFDEVDDATTYFYRFLPASLLP